MRYRPIFAALILLSTSALAQPADWSKAPQVAITLSSFKFDPSTIHLRANQPVVLHLVNASRGGHNFSAPEFFAASSVRSQDQTMLHNGAVNLPGHQSKDIALVPRAGTYKLRCTHMMHSAFGMRGQILVD